MLDRLAGKRKWCIVEEIVNVRHGGVAAIKERGDTWLVKFSMVGVGSLTRLF